MFRREMKRLPSDAEPEIIKCYNSVPIQVEVRVEGDSELSLLHSNTLHEIGDRIQWSDRKAVAN